MTNPRFKFLIIFVSYLWFLVAAYFLDWSPATVFFAYYLELIAILIFYLVVRTVDQKQRPQYYHRHPSSFNIAVGAGPFLFVQYLLISVAISHIDPDFDFTEGPERFLSTSVILSFAVLIVVYLLRMIQISSNEEREKLLRENYFFQSLSLSATNMAGVIAVIAFEFSGLMPVLILMTAARIVLEYFFQRKIRIL